MVNTLVGNIGHLSIILAFVSALIVGIGYFLSQRAQPLSTQQSWLNFARIGFGIHSVAVISVIASLFYIIYNHLYEYHYAYDHSSNNLPVHYMISCFWEGQEGSFLLWIFWNVLIGGILILTNKKWEAPVMTIFAVVQAFLASMILGVVFFGSFKVGSSPFILTSEVLDIPVYDPSSPAYNANFIPADGNGLNPLLQNYWMVIHPPTLFLGFALTLVPFAFVVAGLWKKQYTQWIRPNLPWALLSAAVLGLGILMGAYWAYETLNFGGYWNWDPVENAVYVPWLVLVAAIHTMVAAPKSTVALKTSIILTIASFVLILYSTFLTRSGILGNASVHSFTDLGLSGQLLLYLLSFLVFAVILAIIRWKTLPSSDKEMKLYSQEFWVLIGAMILCLSGFQVINTTSFPVYSKIAQFFNPDANFALPADQVAHYTKFQLWVAIIIATLSGIGQLFWWNKLSTRERFMNKIATPLVLTLVATSLVILFTKETDFIYMVIILAAVFSIFMNGATVVNLVKKQPKLSGGAITHIGVALMLLGILYSAGYSKVVSLNTTTLVFTSDEDAPEDFNKENVLLWLDEPMQMAQYRLTYKGMFIEADQFPSYIRQRDVVYTEDPFRAIVLKDVYHNGKKYFTTGDTIATQPENIYYKVEYKDKKGRIFHLFPRLQINAQMGEGGFAVSPDIKKKFGKDLYTHVTMIYPDPNEGRQWGDMEEYTVSLKDTFFLNDYVAIFEGVEPLKSTPLMQLSEGEMAVQARLRIMGKNKEHFVTPTFLIRQEDGMVARPPEVLPELGLQLTFLNINPQTQEFTFGVNAGQKDFIIMKAIEKPMINLLWIGAIIMLVGFGMAIKRRFESPKKVRKKPQPLVENTA
ncbi:MAG: cytochrome c biogenesis protein CcsA [Thermonemataceae bacterium]